MAVAVYLAGPLDDVDAQARAWVDGVVEHAAPTYAFFVPGRAYVGSSLTSAEAVDRMNRAVIARCDALLAYLAGPGRAFGTIREVEYARSLHKPVVVVGELASLLRWDVECVVSLTEALTWISRTLAAQRQDTGRHV